MKIKQKERNEYKLKILFQTILFAFTAMIVENMIFARALGTSTILVASKNKKQLVGFGFAITYITVISSMLTFLLDRLFLGKTAYTYLMPFAYVLCISIVYVLTLLLMWKFLQPLFVKVKKFVHTSAFNCAVLGALFLNSNSNRSFREYIIFALASGIGFMLAAYFLKIAHDRMSAEYVSKSFRGYPLMFIYIGILSMAFYGLLGHQIVL